jgi:hypothetical protein
MEELGGFFSREAKEEAEFDHAALFRIDPFKLFENTVEVDHFGVARIDPGEFLMKRDRDAAVAFLAMFRACVIHKDSAHETGGEAIKVFAIFEFQAALADEFEEELVDHAGGLQYAFGALATKEGSRDDAELGINHLEQRFDGRRFPFAPLMQQHGYFAWFRQGRCPYGRARTVYTV